jgi:TonB family protein
MQEVVVSGYGVKRKEGPMKDEEKVNLFRGRVVDVSNNPLPFANITNTRDNVGTYTDVRGNFTLISPDSTLDVQVRSVGFESNLARLKNNVAANQIILQEDKTLPEKVIIYKKTDSIRSRTANMMLEEPEPVDGWSNYDVYLANNINVSGDFKKEAATGGQVRLSFEVNQHGNPTNIRVEKSLCKECDEEAIRAVKEGPKWKRKNKKAKRVTISVPFDSRH